MKRLNKSEFLNKSQRRVIDVEIFDGETVQIKSLSAAVALEIQKCLQTNDQIGFVYLLIGNSVIDDEGKSMFTEDEIAEMDYSVVDRLSLECMSLNNIAPDVVAKAREALKNQKRSSTTN